MNNKILIELIENQISNIDTENKLYLSDMQRLSKNINDSIFDKNNCCLWNGTKIKKNNNKGYYINFYFNKKKMSLHRILYINFIGNLNKNEYLKFTCCNKGLCCNINHITKIKKKENKLQKSESLITLKKIPSNNNLTIQEDNFENKLKIIF